MIILNAGHIRMLVREHGADQIFRLLVEKLEDDFKRWHDFYHVPRLASHFPHGVIELMPTFDEKYYSFKYVNGHPRNTSLNKPTVMATGQLSDVETGEPLLYSEMVLLTAIRTAAVSAMAAKYLSKKDVEFHAIIGTGAQSEFQAKALSLFVHAGCLKYFDTDPKAMVKFGDHMSRMGIPAMACQSLEEALKDADLVTTLTAAKTRSRILDKDSLHDGLFINAVGGDCPGKTELAPEILDRCKIVAEFKEQSFIEGEIQSLPKNSVITELHEVISGKAPGRSNPEEIILFDSVGVAIEDYSTLALFYDLALDHPDIPKYDLLPETEDPKNLFEKLL